MMLEFLGMLAVGLPLATVLVRHSARRSLGVALPWAKALKIVVLRSGAALGAGVAVGVALSALLDSQVVSKQYVQDNLYSLLAGLAVCGVRCAVW